MCRVTQHGSWEGRRERESIGWGSVSVDWQRCKIISKSVGVETGELEFVDSLLI